MLTIKRVPTFVSNYQKDILLESNVVGCGRKCLEKCFLVYGNINPNPEKYFASATECTQSWNGIR
ncbi:hypothetical protein P3S67_005361 [Capsicum chacoense]